MKRRGFTLAGFLILFVILGASIPTIFLHTETQTSAEIEALNKKIADKKDRVKQLEKSIEEYKKKIDQKRLMSVSLSNQMAILDDRISEVHLDIEATEAKLDTLTLEIEGLQLSITEKEKILDKQKEMIAELLRTLHQENDKNFIEILAVYDNFSDFYNRIQYLSTIDSDLGKNVRGLKDTKRALEEKKMETEERKVSYASLKETLSQKKKDLEEQINHKQQLLAETQASELTFKTLLSSLRGQYQEIEGEISGIEKEVRRRLEEQKKITNAPTDERELSWPTQSRYITARFHDPDYPYRHIFEHNAIDLRAAQGTAVKAASSGYIARAKRCTTASCYSFVMIVHSGGISTVYGHLSQVGVNEDQFVTRGDVIGYSGGMPGTAGAGPFVTGPHLHFEVRKNGIPVDPTLYLVKDY